MKHPAPRAKARCQPKVGNPSLNAGSFVLVFYWAGMAIRGNHKSKRQFPFQIPIIDPKSVKYFQAGAPTMPRRTGSWRVRVVILQLLGSLRFR